MTISAEDLREVGDSVLATVVQRGVGRESGVTPTEFRYFHVWTFRGGKVIRLEILGNREDALEVLGLGD